MSHQYPRESWALHFDYYSKTKKTASGLTKRVRADACRIAARRDDATRRRRRSHHRARVRAPHAFGDRFKIYITGDTDHSELLASVAKHSPQVLITCINGNYNNLSHWEAAEVAKWINPKIAIPCHYDMFPDNSLDPAQFRASLKIRAPNVEYYQLSHAKAHLLG